MPVIAAAQSLALLQSFKVESLRRLARHHASASCIVSYVLNDLNGLNCLNILLKMLHSSMSMTDAWKSRWLE
jgi:hypothetical protein